jgi:hypothetical protein
MLSHIRVRGPCLISIQNGLRFCDVRSSPFEEGEKLFRYVVEAVEGPAEVDVCVDSRMEMRGAEMEALVI